MPNPKSRTVSVRMVDPLYRKTTLDNGIRVVSETIPYVRSVSLGVWANVGSRDESVHCNGLSHFLEHMVFKGTRKRTVKDIAQSLESLGGYLNAFTTKEQTCFYARVLDAHVSEALDVISDLVLHATFKHKELEKEKQVVIEELRNAEDDPEDIIHDYFEKALFPKHALGFPIIGTEKTLRTFRRADLRHHAASHYLPENIVVAAAGRVDHAKLVKLVDRHFGKFAGRSKPGLRTLVSPERGRGGFQEYRKPIQQSHMCFGTIGYSIRHADRYPLLVLNGLLGEGMSSRLYQLIREKHALAYSVYSFVSMLSDTGVFGVYIGTDQKNVEHAAAIVQKELGKLKTRYVPEAELERTKSQIKGSLMLGLESMSNRMMRLGGGELHLGEYVRVDTVLRNIDAVTSDSIQRVAKDLFVIDHFSTVVVRPV